MKFYKNKLSCLIILIFALSCSVKKKAINNVTEQGITVTISGKTKKINGAKVSLTTEDYKQAFWTDTIKNDGFGATINVPGPGFYRLQFEGKYPPDSIADGWLGSINIYLENNYSYKIPPATDWDIQYSRVKVHPSSTIQEKLSLFDISQHDELWRQKVKLDKEHYEAELLLKEHRDKEYKKLSESILKDEYYSKHSTSIITRAFALKNPESIVSAHKLLDVNDIQERYNEYLNIYNKLDDAVKNQQDGIAFKRKLDAIAKLTQGNPLPQIAGTDPSGKAFHYNFADQKLTLVYFWASWNKHSYDDHFQLVQLYNKYHKSGFDIVGVSLDVNSNLWKTAIQKDGLIWANHYSELKRYDLSENVSRFNIVGVPESYLVNSKGEIVTKNIALDSLSDLLSKQH